MTDIAEDLARDPATGVYEPTGRVSSIARTRARAGAVPGVTGFLDTIIDLVEDGLNSEPVRQIGDALLVPLETLLALIRNGARLVFISGVVYLLGPPVLSGYISGKVARRGTKKKRKARQ